MNDGVALEDVLQTVGDLVVAIKACTGHYVADGSEPGIVRSVAVVGAVVVSEPQLDGERAAHEVEFDGTGCTALHAGGVVVVEECAVGGQQEGELTLHGLEVGVVVQVHVVVVDGGLHNKVCLTNERGRGNGAVVGRDTGAVHDVNDAVACHQTGVDCCQRLVDVLEEGLHGVVGELAPLAGNRAYEGALHEVVDEGVDGTQGDGINLMVELVDGSGAGVGNLVLRAFVGIVCADEVLACILEVVPHLLVAGHEDGGHVLADVHLVVISVPSRVEEQTGSDIGGVLVLIGIVCPIGSQRSGLETLGLAVGILLCYVSTLCGIVIIREVPLSKDGVGEVGIENLVCIRDACAIEGCAEAIEDVAEDVRLTVGADDLGHVCDGAEGLLGDVDITVLADTVLLQEECIVDVHVAGVAGVIHEDGKVLVLDHVPRHVLSCEVQHHGHCGVGSHVDAVSALLGTEALPVVLVGRGVAEGQFVGGDIGDGVGNEDVGVATHVLASGGRVRSARLTACQVLHDDGVVEHTCVNQQLLL